MSNAMRDAPSSQTSCHQVHYRRFAATLANEMTRKKGYVLPERYLLTMRLG